MTKILIKDNDYGFNRMVEFGKVSFHENPKDGSDVIVVDCSESDLTIEQCIDSLVSDVKVYAKSFHKKVRNIVLCSSNWQDSFHFHRTGSGGKGWTCKLKPINLNDFVD